MLVKDGDVRAEKMLMKNDVAGVVAQKLGEGGNEIYA